MRAPKARAAIVLLQSPRWTVGERENRRIFLHSDQERPRLGLQTTFVETLMKLNLDVIDHRSWHPRQTAITLVNEISSSSNILDDGISSHQRVHDRMEEIRRTISVAISQEAAVVKVERWFPEIADELEGGSVSEHIVVATSRALQNSMRENKKKKKRKFPRPRWLSPRRPR